MFKNMLKRSWRSITRRPGRTIIMTLIFFAMATLVLAGLMVKSSVSAQLSAAKQSLGGTVTIQADMDKMRQSQEKQASDGTDRKEVFGKMQRPAVSVKTANKIAGYTDYVKDYSYQLSTRANAGGLETVESTGPGGNDKGGGPGRPGEESSGSSDATLDTNLTISGVSSYDYIDGVSSGEFTLKSGNKFDEDSDNKVLVSYEFAQLNSLKVGDKIKLKNAYTEKEIELTVCGIYDSSAFNADGNTLYMNTATAAKFLSGDDYNDGDYRVSDVKYYMVDSGKADEFVKKVNSDFSSLSDSDLKISVDTTKYDRMKSQLDGVGKFANIVLIIVAVAAIVIVALIVTLNVRDRCYEMGVLLSLGAKKLNVIGQFAVELLVTGTLGLALAAATGTVFAKSIGNSLVQAQINQTSEQTNNMGRPDGDKGGDAPAKPDEANDDDASSGDASNNSTGTSTSSDKPTGNGEVKHKLEKAGAKRTDVKLDINASPSDCALLFLLGYVVIILSLIVPSINIMRYQPKKILEGRG